MRLSSASPAAAMAWTATVWPLAHLPIATTVSRSQALGLDPQAAIAAFDAGPLFTALGDSVVTGPTGNNLRDLRILLSA